MLLGKQFLVMNVVTRFWKVIWDDRMMGVSNKAFRFVEMDELFGWGASPVCLQLKFYFCDLKRFLHRTPNLLLTHKSSLCSNIKVECKLLIRTLQSEISSIESTSNHTRKASIIQNQTYNQTFPEGEEKKKHERFSPPTRI